MARNELAAVVLCAAVVSAAAIWWVQSHGCTLYFGDAEAHLNIARRIVDSRTPGIDQFGTAWLPLPHALMLPFVRNDDWWRSGLAGAVPSGCAFVAACAMFYAATRRLFASSAAAVTSVAVFALNPNILYLQSIPMTEAVFFAALAGLLLSTVVFQQTGSLGAVLAAAVFSNMASLTRYEGWFLIPFVAAFLLITGGRRRWIAVLLFGSLASLAPLAWLAYNWWFYRNPLEFYNGPYSAKGIYERSMRTGVARYPGEQDWGKAFQYYWAAARLCAGAPLAWIAALGTVASMAKRLWWPVLLLALPPLFYVISLHGPGAEIFVPQLWPHSYYNTRYGTAVMPLFAIAAAALAAVTRRRTLQIASAAITVIIASAPWLLSPDHENWITWKESQVNSEARRAWTTQSAAYLAANYRPDDGVFTSFGDLTGIFRTASVPLERTLHEGNNPEWMAAERRPGLFLHEAWALGFADSDVARAAAKNLYTLAARIRVPGAPPVEIYRRTEKHDQDPFHQSPRR